MEQDAGLAEVGGHAYLVALARAAPALPNVKDYARILADLAMRRELIRIGEDIVNTAFEAPIEIGPERADRRGRESALRGRREGTFRRRPAQSFDVALAQAVTSAERALARGGNISGVSTGYTDLDALLGGLHPSDLIIVAGRPGMGKTALATNMAFYAARLWAKDKADGTEPKRGAPRAVCFSLEMAASQLSARILSEQTEVEMRKDPHRPFHRFRVGPLRAHRAGAGRPSALYRRYRRHLDRTDRRARAAHEAREKISA